MGYCVEYTQGSSRNYPIKTKQLHRKSYILWGVLAMCFALLLVPEIRNCLKQFLLPGDPAVTETAFLSMVDRIGAGESFYDAVTAFCEEIIQGAAI